MENKFLLAKNYNPYPDYKLSNYIDAKDTVNHWCVGQIVDIDEEKNLVKVHFEGWSTRYDELIRRNAPRIGPFRRHTEGYTGQKKNAYRDFKMSITEHKVMQQKVQETIKEEFKNLETPLKVTQFIRGELYFYVDSLISMISCIQQEDLPVIFEFMLDVFKLIFKWMEIFPQYLTSYQESLHHPNLYLVNYEASVAMCGNELFGILEKCFGGCMRCLKFFQKYSTIAIPTDGPNNFAAKEKVQANGMMGSFINAFGNMNGFTRVLDFISFDIKDGKGNSIKGCPFTLTMKILFAFKSAFEYLERNFAQKLAEDVCSALIYRLDNLSENEIKELDKDILHGIIEVLKDYMIIINPNDADKIGELKELQIAQKYLRCPFFEKRVRGINELKEIYNKVQNAANKGRNNDQYSYTKWLTIEKYQQWLIQEKIIEFIFVEFPHVELIKRSGEIMRLLACNEAYFSQEIVEMLWVCASEKHEDITRATLELIQDLAQFMPLERLAQFSMKLKVIKESDFDEKLVNFLKQFTLNAMKNIRNFKLASSKGQGIVSNIMNKKKEVKIDETKYIDLTLFWQIFQDQNKVSQKVKDQALNSLIEILQEFNEKEYKDMFTGLAIENLKKSNTFFSSIVFLRKVINTYPLDSQIKFKPTSTVITVQIVLAEIMKKYDIFDLILQNLSSYLKQSHEIKQRLLQSTSADKISQQNLASIVPHEDFIDEVMSFIQFLITYSKSTLSFDHIERMFQLMVTNGVTEYESNQLFNLITKENDIAKSKERKFLLDDKVRNQVFQKIFSSNKYLNLDKMNLRGFSCFKKLFLIVNEEEKALEPQREDRVVVNSLNSLQGIQTLWGISIYSELPQVKEQSRDFLVDLYLNVKSKSSQQKKQVNEQFQQMCFQYIKNLTEKPELQLNGLRLIRNFINRFDGEHIYEEDLTKYPQQELRPLEVTLNPDKLTKQVLVHPNQKMWQLKRKMASAFRLRLSEFYIKTKTGPLLDSCYDDTISDYKIEKIHIQRFPQEDIEKEFPRYLIGYNKEYLSMFLDLLRTSKEECRREILTLLDNLPINVEVKVYLRERILAPQTGDKAAIDWGKLFSVNKQELSTCCYYLMALEDLIIPRKDQPNQETVNLEVQTKQDFAIKLLSTGGFKFLFELFRSIDKSSLEKDIIKTKILTLLLKIFSHLFTIKQNSAFKTAISPQDLEVLIQQTLATVENYILGVYNQQVNGGIPTGEERNVRLLKRETQLFSHSITFMNRAFQFNHSLIQTMYEYSGIKNVVRLALIDLDIKTIQDQTQQLIGDISIKLDLSPNIQVKPSFFFIQLFLQECLIYSLQVQKPEKTATFFNLLNEVFMKTEVYKELHKIQPVNQLAKTLSEHIITREIKEISARDEDIPLQGLFMFLKNIFLKFPEIRDSFEGKNSLLQYLIHDCLFRKETRGQTITRARSMPPKCKNNTTRERCLELLNELCTKNTEGIQILIRYLKNHISETFWRTPRKSDWSISVHQQERSLTGFVGLKNIGCICYMNSIMQQLFMIPTFRKAILEVEDANYGKESDEENVLQQLKMIFGGLMEIERQYFNPKKFCMAFKDIDGSPIDPMVQKDVDEFFNMAIDRVETLVKGKKEEKVIKNLYQGVFANEFICKGCPHYSEREENFMTISLQVKNKHSIQESLESFVEGEMLEGDNAYYCEKCEKKVNTLKRCCIKRMPNVLFMVLKRFEFNFDTMNKFKINDYCEFPMKIDMKEYCQQSLAKKDLIKMMEDKNMTMEDLSEEQRATLERELPSKYYEYNLRGCVIHIGTAEQGHYISYIQDRESQSNRWYEFNDQLVREFDPEDIPNEAFGGDDESFVSNLNISQMQGSGYTEQQIKQLQQMKTKIKNAYILIYERDDMIDMEKFNELMDDPNINTNQQNILRCFDQCKQEKASSAKIQIPHSVHDFILEKNKKFWLSKFIFNHTYITSVLEIFKQVTIEEDFDYLGARTANLQEQAGNQFEMFKFLTTFFLTTVIRAKERGRTVPHFMQMIREALKKNVGLCVWLLESFNNQDLIKEFLIDCPISDMKRFVSGLLKTAMQTVYKFEEQSIQAYTASIDTGVVDFIQQTQQAHVKGVRKIDNQKQTRGGENIDSGSCSNLTVVSLAHHNEKLPVLVLMINSFIHMNVSPHYFRSQELTAQFYQVFSYFSDLGEQARHYLLKCKTVGRLLDLFFYPDISGNKQAPHISEKFRNSSLEQIPFFTLEKEFYMKSNLEKQDAKISNIERKGVLNEAVPPQMFLLYTVSKLSRSCLYVKDPLVVNPLANDKLNFSLDDNEVSMIINHENPMIWVFCDKKVTRNAVAQMYAHMSFNSKSFSLQFMTTLLIGLQKSFFEEMKIYEKPLIAQLMIKDDYQEDRVKKVISNLSEFLKQSVSNYKEFDSLVEILHKILQRSFIAVEILNKQNSLISFIERWQKENPHFPLNQSKTRVFKQGIIQWNSKLININQQTVDKVTQYTKDRLQKIQALVQKEVPVNENAYDSDDDQYQHEFAIKEKVDFIDQMGNTCMGYTDFVLDEMVKCVSEVTQPNQKPTVQWIGTDSDNIAPFGGLTNEKKNMHIFYLRLLKTIQN